MVQLKKYIGYSELLDDRLLPTGEAYSVNEQCTAQGKRSRLEPSGQDGYFFFFTCIILCKSFSFQGPQRLFLTIKRKYPENTLQVIM